MAIKNYVSNDFLFLFLDSINILDGCLPGVFNVNYWTKSFDIS